MYKKYNIMKNVKGNPTCRKKPVISQCDTHIKRNYRLGHLWVVCTFPSKFWAVFNQGVNFHRSQHFQKKIWFTCTIFSLKDLFSREKRDPFVE